MTSMSLLELESGVGVREYYSRWFLVDQSRIDKFADSTDDHQFIHVDSARASETMFGGTIAHGFLSLSLLSAMIYDARPSLTGSVMGINYGFERIRFLSPVRSGSEVRGCFVVSDIKRRSSSRVLITNEVKVEIKNESRPALMATWLELSIFDEDASDDSDNSGTSVGGVDV